MYVELITILVRAKDDITRACRRCQSTLYIVFNIAKVGGPHKPQIAGESLPHGRDTRVSNVAAVPQVSYARSPFNITACRTV